MLAMYVSSDHQDWDVALPFVTFAYNSSRHDAAGFSPFYLVFGRHPTLPFDTIFPTAVDFTTEYTRDAITRARKAREVARQRLLASQDHQRHRYDSHHRQISFTPGSLVLLWTPTRRVGLSEKLLSRYSGPYRVLRQVTDVTYEIAPLESSSASASLSTDIVHVSRLKLYHSATQ